MKQPADPHPGEVLDVLRRRGPETRIAVVGASSNPQKYGNIILKNLAGGRHRHSGSIRADN